MEDEKIEKELQLLAKTFKYVADPKLDNWQIMSLTNPEGDCDDYAVTALYIVCGGSLFKFWLDILTLKAIFWHTTSPSGGPHLVLYYRGKGYIDNWDRKWVKKQELLDWGYKFNLPLIFPFPAIKMFFGVLAREFKKVSKKFKK